ncbi:hypothetical protein [Enterococcus phage vB_Efs8_KEN04]
MCKKEVLIFLFRFNPFPLTNIEYQSFCYLSIDKMNFFIK